MTQSRIWQFRQYHPKFTSRQSPESSLFVRSTPNEIFVERPRCYAFYSVFGQERRVLGKRGNAEKLGCSMGREVRVDPQLTEPAGAANDLSNPSVGERSDEALGCG